MESEQKPPTEISDTVGKLSKTIPVISQGYGIWKSIVPSIGILFIMALTIYGGAPVYLVLPFGIFLILIFVLQILYAKRIATTDLSAVPSVATQQQVFEYDPQESVSLYVAGILRNGMRGVTILGKGEIKHPENALIITSKRVIFVYVPLLGADKLVGGIDIGRTDFYLAKGEILKKLEDMITTKSLPDIFQSYPANYFLDLDSIIKVKISSFLQNVTFFTVDGKKYGYTIRNKDDKEKMRSIMAQLGKI